ncbi:MAG: hypothetical protein EOR81_11340 [Mesorhizobium sp.]|nr:MAG: hypothetical protein EOR81_11340 [Mesorhizobium sp.]
MKGDCIARLLRFIPPFESRSRRGNVKSHRCEGRRPRRPIAEVGAAPHLPASIFLPMKNGEKELSRNADAPSPRPSRGEGKGEGQRKPEAIALRNGRSGLAYDIYARHVRAPPAALPLHRMKVGDSHLNEANYEQYERPSGRLRKEVRDGRGHEVQGHGAP